MLNHQLSIVLDNNSSLYNRASDWFYMDIYGFGFKPSARYRRKKHSRKLVGYMHNRIRSYIHKNNIECYSWTFKFARRHNDKDIIYVILHKENHDSFTDSKESRL